MSSPLAAEQQPSDIPVSSKDGEETPQQQSLKNKTKRFLGIGKKKEDEKAVGTSSTASQQDPAISSASAPLTPVPAPATTPLEIPRAPRSPPQTHGLSAAASPARSGRLRSLSPRRDPDSSSIFERNVQDNTIPDDLAKDLAIPSHIQTEDHIPPALEASTIAITDDLLGPDEVKIVTHAAHQPAAEKVVGTGGGAHTPSASDAGLSPIGGLSPIEDPGINIHQSLESSQSLGGGYQTSALAQSGAFAQPQAGGNDDGASSYAAGADAADVRRLSFISFADVVQSEHVDQANAGRDSVMNMSLHSLNSPAPNRSPSPIRSPVSIASQGPSGSPPTSGAPSMMGPDVGGKAQPLPPASPGRATAPGPTREGGEIVVETMRQALRRTGSGDLRHAASSPVEGDLPLR